MRFLPATLTAAAVILAQKPEIGLESKVRASPLEVVKLGTINVDSAGVATYTAVSGIVIPTAGYDLHLRTDDTIGPLTALPTVTLSVSLFGAVASTVVATLGIPSWVQDQSKIWPLGQSTDFIPQGVGNDAKTVLSITALDDSENLPANSTWSVWGSPAAANFVSLGYCRNKEGPYTVPGNVRIADGYNPQAAIKRGRAEDSDLTLEFVHISSMDGISRLNDRRCAVLLDVTKDKTVLSERVVYAGYRPAAGPKRGDGNDEVIETSTGPFESFLLFVAP